MLGYILHKGKLWPAGDSQTRGSLKGVGFTLRRQWMSVQNWMAIHPIVGGDLTMCSTCLAILSSSSNSNCSSCSKCICIYLHVSAHFPYQPTSQRLYHIFTCGLLHTVGSYTYLIGGQNGLPEKDWPAPELCWPPRPGWIVIRLLIAVDCLSDTRGKGN